MVFFVINFNNIVYKREQKVPFFIKGKNRIFVRGVHTIFLHRFQIIL